MSRHFYIQHGPHRKRRKSAIPLYDLVPLNDAAREVTGNGLTVGDLGPDDHIIHKCHTSLFTPHPGVKARLSPFLFEPPGVRPVQYRLHRWFSRRWHRLFTYDARLLSAATNAVHFNGHVPWVDPSNPIKTGHISVVTSAKRDLPGHRLRLRVSERWPDRLDRFGKAYQPVESKNEALDNYRFSLAVENSRSTGYFTEKVLDCFLTRTIPIYWGDPELGRFFDMDGVIDCQTEKDIDRAVKTVTEQDYEDRRAVIDRNFETAIGYFDLHARLAKALDETNRSRSS